MHRGGFVSDRGKFRCVKKIWRAQMLVALDKTGADSMLISTEPVFAARSTVTVPLVLSKRPCMVEKPRWLMLKCGKV
jgi:hypothetical protein